MKPSLWFGPNKQGRQFFDGTNGPIREDPVVYGSLLVTRKAAVHLIRNVLLVGVQGLDTACTPDPV